ncbi:MAG: TonB family protein [Candidatus Krumholzibacteria bacterium]|nr:TonB family protein [Candidatus Krumholzibacteria bacterium]
MKNAIIISLALHVAVGFVWFRIVKFSHVRFVPRQVFTVSLVTPTEAAPQKPPAVVPEPAPPVPEPAPEEEEDEMPPPPEKPKPKDKPKPKVVKKTIPSTDIQKTVEPEQPQETGVDEQVVTGDMVLGQDFPFAYYLSTMKRKIAALWRVPGTSSTEPLHCSVYFRVGRDGSIQSPSVETSSGTFLFDQAALRAVVQANPLPPLPSGFVDDYLGVHFSFAYEQE